MKWIVAQFVVAAAALLFGAGSSAQELAVTANDSVQSVAAAQKGKRVTVRLRSGQELTGTVREATAKLVVLGALQGREFFDAAIPLEAIDAILVRTKQ